MCKSMYIEENSVNQAKPSDGKIVFDMNNLVYNNCEIVLWEPGWALTGKLFAIHDHFINMF